MKQKKFILDLQFFTEQQINEDQKNKENKENEGNGKVFTQEDFENELKRRKKSMEKEFQIQLEEQKLEIEELVKKNSKDFQKLTEEQQAIENARIEKERIERENSVLQGKLLEFERKSRKSEVIEKYSSDKLPCQKEFNDLSILISNIDDEEERAEIYLKFKNYANAIKDTITKELLKGKENPSSSNDSANSNNSENPFIKGGSMTQCQNLISMDYEKAKKLWVQAGSPTLYKKVFE